MCNKYTVTVRRRREEERSTVRRRREHEAAEETYTAYNKYIHLATTSFSRCGRVQEDKKLSEGSAPQYIIYETRIHYTCRYERKDMYVYRYQYYYAGAR